MISLDAKSVFDRYPELSTLKGRVPDDLVVDEVKSTAEEYEHYSRIAVERIPTVLLSEIFPPEVEQAQIVLKNFLGTWGNVTIEELCKLSLITKWLNPRKIFEFGTYNGMTTLQLAMNSGDESEVFTLDIEPTDTSTSELSIGGIDRYLAQKQGAFQFEVGHYFSGTPQAEKIKQLWGDSRSFDFSPYAGKISLAFVDAGHTYEYVSSDTKNALAMLSNDGVVIWHDYMRVLHPGVLRCLVELTENGSRIFRLRGTNMAVYWNHDNQQ